MPLKRLLKGETTVFRTETNNSVAIVHAVGCFPLGIFTAAGSGGRIVQDVANAKGHIRIHFDQA